MAEPPVDRPASPSEQPGQPRPSGPQFSRRAFLGGAAGAAGLAALRPFGPLRLIRQPRPLDDITNPYPPPITTGGGPDFMLTVERQSDLVLLDFSFYGFNLVSGTPPTIVPYAEGNTIVVQFPPQAIAEGEYYWHPQSNGDNVLPVDPPPILSDVSGPSWLCFNVPTTETIPLPTMTAADLLDWSSWSLVVPPAAQVNGPTSIIIVGSSDDSASTTDPRSPSEPTALQTAIEFPYALFLAPAVYASGLPIYGFTTEFTSRAAPLVSSAGVVDLWSASLAGSSTDIIFEDNNAMYVPPVSAFWASDYAPPTLGALDATPEEYIVYGKPIPLQ